MEDAIIDKVREYIARCPHLKEYAELNINYLTDKSRKHILSMKMQDIILL